MLHHVDAVLASGDGRSSGRTRRNRKDGDDEGSRTRSGNDGLRLQLLRTDGLQVLRQHLQGFWNSIPQSFKPPVLGQIIHKLAD